MRQQRRREQALQAKKKRYEGGGNRYLRLILPGIGVMAMAGLLAVFLLGRSPVEGRQFPSYAYNSSFTLQGYQAALNNQDMLPVMPCYCGCGPGQHHISLKDCFFKEDGSFNDHASNCHLCVEEAAFIAEQRSKGQSAKEIRAQIEEKYSPHGPGTKTPPIV